MSDDVFRLPFLGGTGPDTPLEVPLDPLVFLALEAREFFPLFTTASKESLSREFSLKMDTDYRIYVDLDIITEEKLLLPWNSLIGQFVHRVGGEGMGWMELSLF